MIRCNKCGRLFENEESLTKLIEVQTGADTISVMHYDPLEGYEGVVFNGCPDCFTDEYLMDLDGGSIREDAKQAFDELIGTIKKWKKEERQVEATFINRVFTNLACAIMKHKDREFIDLFADTPFPDQIAKGHVLTVWGEENGKGERYYSVYVKEGDDICFRIDAESVDPNDLLDAVRKAYGRIAYNEAPKKKRKSRAKFQKGRTITSLDELMCQERAYFYDKIYSRGWFGSWQLAWTKAQIDRGVIRYAIPKEDAK